MDKAQAGEEARKSLAAAEEKARKSVDKIEARMAADKEAASATIAELEEAHAKERESAAAAAEGAATRIAAAEKATETMRDEMRRSVGAERQRVAGMLYKEALQTHTLEEQTLQLETLNAEIAETRQELSESKQAVAALTERVHFKEGEIARLKIELQALSESRSEHVNSILSLDETLAMEQETRMEQERVLGELQAALSERTAKEATTANRATEIEQKLEALKKSYRELRLQVAAKNLKKCSTSTQTETDAKKPEIAVQTDWQAVHMPLPAIPSNR